MDMQSHFGSESPLVGMVHLSPLPGSPRFDGDRRQVRGRALADAYSLVEGGFDSLVVENLGDTPYYPDDVPKHTVAEMTAVARELGIGVDCPYGINVLRNDAEAALSVPRVPVWTLTRTNDPPPAAATDRAPAVAGARPTRHRACTSTTSARPVT